MAEKRLFLCPLEPDQDNSCEREVVGPFNA